MWNPDAPIYRAILPTLHFGLVKKVGLLSWTSGRSPPSTVLIVYWRLLDKPTSVVIGRNSTDCRIRLALFRPMNLLHSQSLQRQQGNRLEQLATAYSMEIFERSLQWYAITGIRAISVFWVHRWLSKQKQHSHLKSHVLESVATEPPCDNSTSTWPCVPFVVATRGLGSVRVAASSTLRLSP